MTQNGMRSLALITRLIDLEAIDEQRQQAEENMTAYHGRITQAYNRTVKERIFKEGDLVLRIVD